MPQGQDVQEPVRALVPAKKMPIELPRPHKTNRVLRRRGLHSKFALFLSSSYQSSNGIPTLGAIRITEKSNHLPESL